MEKEESKGNRFKNETPEKKRKKKGKLSWLHSILSFFRDERTHKITGLTLILLSVYLFIAFTSHLFTWKADQSNIINSAWNFLTDTALSADNWLGKAGAVVAHVFMHKWFGVSSYVFVLLFFLAGFRMLTGMSLLPFWKTVRYSFLFILWVPVTLAYIFHDSNMFAPGGGFGVHLNNIIGGWFGFIGTGFLLFFSLLVFLVAVFNIPFVFKKKEEVIPAGDMLSQPLEISNESEIAPAVLPDEIPKVVDLTEPPEVTPVAEPENVIAPLTDPAVELDPVAENLNPEEQKEEGEVQLSIEESQADATVGDNGEVTTVPDGPYDPTLELSSYQFPPLDLLENYGSKGIQVDREELEQNKNKIVNTLSHYNIGIDKIKATIGPTVTLYEIIPQAGVRIAKIKNLEDDIALSLSALGIRIIAPIPGKGTIGIEVPNQKPETVSMRSVLASEKFVNAEMDLPIAIGKTISNEVFVADLAKMPHLLMAGATGQGKSVGLNAIIASILYKKHPSQVKFVMVDPKKVELTLYKKLERHFLAKLPDSEEAIINDTKKVIHTLNSLCIEMDQRYELLKDAGVRNVKEYNAKFTARRLNPNKGHRFLPYIILVVDEFADLIMTAGKEIETPLARLAQLARAIGIHLIIATQRPSVNIITGTIKANFPARIAFRVMSKIDSRTILDAGGADQLVGRGDMLLSTGADLTRIQCAFLDTPEVEKVADFIGSQRGYPDAHLLPEYIDDTEQNSGAGMNPDERDAMFEEAARIVVQHQQGSASLLQRRLKLGYNRAGRIVDQLEAAGIIGPFEGSKAREVLIKDPMSLEQFLNKPKDQPT